MSNLPGILGRRALMGISQLPIKRSNTLVLSPHPRTSYLIYPAIVNYNKIQCASISTSKKDRETHSTTEVSSSGPNKDDKPTLKKYWVSYGFSHLSEEEDGMMYRLVMFWTVTFSFVFLGFIFTYKPKKLNEWAQREAYIELARREALGLPRIDPDLIPRENIILPSEEELAIRSVENSTLRIEKRPSANSFSSAFWI